MNIYEEWQCSTLNLSAANDSTVFILIQLWSSSMMTSNSLMASRLGQESTVPYE
jgi:hypothetical protein